MREKQKFPEPADFENAKDVACNKAIDAVFRSFDESKDSKVQSWAKESMTPEFRATLAWVTAYCFKQVLHQYYEFGFGCGVAATASLTKQDGLGERTIVTAYDSMGRIAEMAKIPLTVEERIALDAQKSPAGE